MAVTLTEKAATHVQNFLAKRGKGVALRLGVRTTGCSGMAYKLEYADAVNPDDIQFESHGVKVVIDPKSLPYLEGTELDFAREGLNEGFKFKTYGCGSAIASSSLVTEWVKGKSVDEAATIRDRKSVV